MTRLQKIAALLKSESTLVLATTDAAGDSRSTPLFFICDDDFRLYWFSSASTGHSRDLRRHPRAAVAVYRTTAEWKKICGVQMRGSAVPISDRAQRKEITATYCKRFGLGAMFRATLSRSTLYAFRPSWIRYIDNRRHFGYKFEMSFPDPD